MASTILIYSDPHIGSTVGLCKRANELDDGGTYLPSAGQLWLNRCWEQILEATEKRKTGDLYAISNGDLVEGDTKKRSAQVITRNPANVAAIAADLIDPLAQMSRGLFFVRGTPAHVGKSASLEEQIAADFDNVVKCPETGRASWWWLPLEIEGLLLDIAHHPGIGVSKNPMTAYNGINQLAARVLFQYANEGRRIPDLVIRSHNHTHRDSLDNYRVRAITTPALTLATEYINMLNPGGLASVGALLIHASAGHFEVENLLFTGARQSTYFIGGA